MLLQEHLQQNSEEEWLYVPFNHNYMVSNCGQVKSLDREVPYIQKNQYGETQSIKKLKAEY